MSEWELEQDDELPESTSKHFIKISKCDSEKELEPDVELI